MKILLTGGGSGGHIAPILAVVSEIKRLARQAGLKTPEFVLITPDEYFSEAVAKADIKAIKIKAGKMRRYLDLENVTDIIKIFIGTVQSIFFIWKFKPDAVFSKGGFAGVPAVFASWLLGYPVITHESDITPGLANRINACFASKVLVSFDETRKYFDKNKTILTGNPIRENISAGSIEAGRRTFGIDESLPTLLVFGGSQGARRINEVVLESLENLLEKFNVIHICGKNNYSSVKEAAEKKDLVRIKRYKLYAFLNEEMKDAYAVCDLVVSRAGANSIAEIIEIGKPGIIIPLSTSANDHQKKNAEWLSERGLVLVIDEKDLSGAKLFIEIIKLHESEKNERKISKNIVEYKNGLKLRPAQEIAQAILDNVKSV